MSVSPRTSLRAAEAHVHPKLLPVWEEIEAIKRKLEWDSSQIKTTDELAKMQQKVVQAENKHRDSNGVWHAEEIIDTGIEPTKEAEPILAGQASLTLLTESVHRLIRSFQLQLPAKKTDWPGEDLEKRYV